MKLLMIRHGKAEDREVWATKKLQDNERPLTSEGIEEFTQVSKALPALISKIDRIFSSPFKRTMQTAEILQKFFPDTKITAQEVLLQGTSWKDVQNFLLKEWNKDGLICIIGHENHMSTVLAGLLNSTDENMLRFKKGGSALIDLELRETRVIG
ncbi:MAG: histidine phosphatase family protein, partial [Proteobacteria bacterium]|nr:histidine phosphatase family protein [Pseudomonadota bacterium]